MAIRVLYISYDGMTDPLGQSQVIPYLIGLSKKGYAFTLISCEKENTFKKGEAKIRSLLKENNIDWHPISYTKWPPVLSTVYDLYQIKRLAFRLHREKKFDIVHCRSYIAALAGLDLKKEYGVKFIFDMRGLWADERVDGKLWDLENPVYKSVYRYFKEKEKQFLLNADYTISLTQNAKEEILSWESVKRVDLKIAVIPCCTDLELFDRKNIRAEKITALRHELNIQQNDFVLLYLGSIGTWYLLDEMMEFFSILKQEKPEAKFLFVSRDEHERILHSAEKLKVKDAVLIRAAAREEIPALIALSSFSVFFILPSYSKKASSPTKQGEIMAMGIPLLCNKGIGDTDKIVQEFKSGILLEEFSIPAYKKAAAEMATSFSSAEIAEGAACYFSLESGVSTYENIYRNVLKDQQPASSDANK